MEGGIETTTTTTKRRDLWYQKMVKDAIKWSPPGKQKQTFSRVGKKFGNGGT